MTRKEIAKRLRELAADPSSGTRAEVQRLRGQYRRARRQQRAETAEAQPRSSVCAIRGLTLEDQAAIETWPLELRARLADHAMSRVITTLHNLPYGG